MTESLESIAKMIDHSLLHPTLTDQELIDGCLVAIKHQVASVCIKPYAVPLAKEILAGSEVKVGTVIGFPHGSSKTEIKLKEARMALDDGAVELDMVVNIGKVLSQDWDYVAKEIRRINRLTARRGALLKVIFENDFLTKDALKIKLCKICNKEAAAFVKTSTGYGFTRREHGYYAYNGATDDDLALMREYAVPSVQVKAAGGVRTLDDVLRVKALGATRVGATATEAILMEARNRGYE
jgi:deoxyribose-phosphate aldolase